MRIYDFTMKDIKGKNFPLAQLEGKLVLIVNVASKCGFTPQYEGLEALYEKYKEKGLVILGFPANDFMFQEPGSNEEIAQFCRLTYGVSFPMFEKIHVRGRYQHELYKYLTHVEGFKGSIKWNFTKFLINQKGEMVGRFAPAETPGSFEKEIEKYL